MAKRSDFTDDEFGAKLVKAYDAAAEAAENFADPNHPRHAVNAWSKIARGESAEDNDRNDESHMPDAGGATDAAPWRNANAPVRIALDKAFATPGKHDASARLALAEAELRMQGFAGDEGMFVELRSFHDQATKARGAAASTRKAVAGYDRLR